MPQVWRHDEPPVILTVLMTQLYSSNGCIPYTNKVMKGDVLDIATEKVFPPFTQKASFLPYQQTAG